MFFLLLLLCLSGGANAQFAEIASLATSLIGPALSGGGLAGLAGTAGQAAGGAAGALGQIGQLYQLAQGALQLTGTGVGVLNQATEGNWFPAALEAAAKNQENIRKTGGGGLGGGGLGGGLGGLGGLMPLGPLGPAPGKSGGSAGVGPEFGTSFPAPDIDDYNEEIDLTSTTTTAKPKSPFGSAEIEDKDLQATTTTTAKTTTAATTVPVTLFPDEEEETSPTTIAPKKQIRIELPKEEEDYIDQVTKEGATEVEVTNREKQGEEDSLEPSPAPVSIPQKKVERGTEAAVPNLEKLVDALKQKSSLTEEEIREIVGQVETNFNHDRPPKIDFGSGVQNINEKKALNRKRIIEASRRIDATNYQGQSHRKLASVTLPSTAAPTPAPFVHNSTPTPEEILNNRLQREILAVGAGDKDLLSSRPVVQQKQIIHPTPVATSPPVVTFVYPPHPQPHTLPQAQIQHQPQVTAQPQQYYYQQPASFPIPQQQQQQPYYQYQQYYPQYYQQYQQQQYGQQYQQQYQQRQQQVVQPQPQVIQPQQYHTQQQILMTGTAQALRPAVPAQQQPAVQKAQQVQRTRQMREGDVRPQRHIHTVSGQSTRIYTNQPAGAAFFVASNGSPVIRRQSSSPIRAQAAKTVRRATPSPSQRRPFARTARTQPLTTPSPVRGEARVPARSNHANQH